MAVEVSVVVCTRNRARRLGGTLEACLRAMEQLPVPAELVVVDNGSSDDTQPLVLELAHRDRRVRCIREPQPGLSRARNSGAAAAAGSVIAFTDDDCLPAEQWLVHLTPRLLSGELAGTAGTVEIAASLRRPWFRPVHEDLLAATRQIPEGPLRTFVGANMALRREVLDELSFDVRLGAGALGCMEESLLHLQMQQRAMPMAFAPEARVVHHFDADRLQPSALLERARVQGRGEGWLEWNWFGVRWPLRRHARWLKLELELATRDITADESGLGLTREIGEMRQYLRARYGLRDDRYPDSPAVTATAAR